MSHDVGFSVEQVEQLERPLDASLIKERPGGGGKQLKYITGKVAIDAANKIFGFGRWGYRVVARSFEKSVDLDGNPTGYFYTADVELQVVGNPFPFPGEGVGLVVKHNPEGHEKARKEAVTDALKRALRHYGDSFGLVLYDQDALVETADGSLVAVKDVRLHSNGQAPHKRIVEAGNGHSSGPTKAIPAPSSTQKPSAKPLTLTQCKQNAASIGMGRPEWDALKLEVLGIPAPDEGLSESEIGRLNAAIEAKKQPAAVGG